MINRIITNIQQDLSQILTENQMEALSQALNKHLSTLAVDKPAVESTKHDMLPLFIAAKRVEGCSEKSLRYYESTIRNMLEAISKPERQITTEDLRGYLDTYQRRGTVSKVTLDNVRRILSSFFAWLEDEDYIVKSPVRRIHKVKTGKTIKETYSDESLELMRDHCDNTRDLAMIDLLASTGIRVGELVKLNCSDVDFESRECIVFGKGNKQRKVYFDARTKIHLQRYLSERKDDNEALFVSLLKPYDRLQISGVEIRLRKIGRELNFNKVHPHKFRRTLATMAIDKSEVTISYNKLWKLLIDRKMSKSDLRKTAQIAPNTMTRLRHDREVSLPVIYKICAVLDVGIGDMRRLAFSFLQKIWKCW